MFILKKILKQKTEETQLVQKLKKALANEVQQKLISICNLG